jgi:hypothetical protein
MPLRLSKLLPALLLVTQCFSCGNPDKKVTLLEAPGTVSDSSCKRNACPSIDFSLVNANGDPLEKSIEKGDIGKDISWGVAVKSDAVSGRIKLALVERPLWIEVKPSSSPGTLDLIGKPDGATLKNSITILARDIGRCRALESVPKDCESSSKSFSDYDRSVSLTYSIGGAAGGSSSGGSTPSGTTSPTGSLH